MEKFFLNIAMDYPVYWSEYTAMNNFIQNFYDALGHERFSEGFQISYSEGVVRMESDTVFCKEWLYYLGASSKRKSEGLFAGQYGEGFKIAALVAYRDMGLGIRMESMDWVLTVSGGEQSVGGTSKMFLAYEVSSRPYANNSILTLTNTKEELKHTIEYELSHFYYETNPLFGELIAKGPRYAFYYPRDTKSKGMKGGLFINYQHRANLRYPIFICNHNYRFYRDDRERGSLNSAEIVDAIRSVTYELSGEAAIHILEAFRPVWFRYYEPFLDRMDWYPVIYNLINAIRRDKEAKERFYKDYADKIVAEAECYLRPKWIARHASYWFKDSKFKHRRRVGKLFTLLGIQDIVSLCDEHGGFEIYRKPEPHEQARISILEEIAVSFFSDICIYRELPECCIMISDDSPANGKARCFDPDKSIRNKYGLMIKYKITEISIRKELIDGPSLCKALPVYLHELLHQYGTDESITFHRALYMMNIIILERSQEIKEYEEQWRNAG